MERLPTKQIYLLLVIIVGIIALSVYSTYAIFTFENETANIVSIYTPKSLNINESIKEYKQVTISSNSYTTVDIDLYNNDEYEKCFRIWYQLVTSISDPSLVKVYQVSDTNNTSGTLLSLENTRISILITNDTDSDVKINLGIANMKNEGVCSLNISNDLEIIDNLITEYQELNTYLINNKEIKNHEEGYLEYKNIFEEIPYLLDEIIVGTDFTYHNELFTLTDAISIKTSELINYQTTDQKKYYTCLSNDNECQTLYQINTVLEETTTNNFTEKKNYKITDYNKLSPYLSGESGIKEYRGNYLYYGDNPDNFIYYNCQNEDDINTCELWRIVGVIYDQDKDEYLTKIIRNDSLNKSIYSTISNTWNESDIYKYLQDEYKVNDLKYLKEFNYQQEIVDDSDESLIEFSLDNQVNKSIFTILNVSDYFLSSSCNYQDITMDNENCFNNNWLNNNDGASWSMSKKIIYDSDTDSEINNYGFTLGNTIEQSIITDEYLIRPVAYLKNRILLISGDGSLDNPYHVK